MTSNLRGTDPDPISVSRNHVPRPALLIFEGPIIPSWATAYAPGNLHGKRFVWVLVLLGLRPHNPSGTTTFACHRNLTCTTLPQAKQPAGRKQRERNQITCSRSGTGKGETQPKLSSISLHSLHTLCVASKGLLKHREQNQEPQLKVVPLSFLIHGHSQGQSYVHIWASRASVQ